MNTTGKHVLITGGSSRTGPPLAPALLAKGAKVAISGRRPGVVAEAARSLQTGSAEIHGIVADVATAEGCAAGWTAPDPGSRHYPEVRSGAVIALLYLPAGRISYDFPVPTRCQIGTS